MRERFLEWGAGLSEEDFACALAAFGVLGGRNRPSKTKGVLDWRFDPKLFDESAAELAKAWRTLIEHHGGTVSLRLDRVALLLQTIDPYWLQSRLARAPGAGLIILADETRFIGRGPVLTSYDLETGPEEGLSYTAPGGEERRTRSKPEVKSRPRKPESRRLQAQLIGRSYPDQRRPVIGALRPGKNYSALIGVGLPAPDRKDVGQPFPDLGDDPKGHDLTVIWEPLAGPGLEARTLHLPPTGDSGTVEFQFKAPEDARSFEARVTILHANRVLQAGLLKAPIGTSGSWTFELDATPRTRLEGLDDRTGFDVALINHEKGMTAASDGQAVVLDVDDGAVRTLIQVLGREISKIADDPARYKGLGSAGSVELLRELAQKGSRVHHHLRLDRLKDARRVHITSVRPESLFPAELLYVHRPPSGEAGLCPHALKALRAGDCTGECPSDKEETVCPLGFWGLSKVIERHAERLESQGRGNVELRPEPVRERRLLPISGSALLAASGRVSEVKKDAVTRLLEKLKKRGDAVLATTWDEWEMYVESKRPRLLILLPHHDKDDQGEFLEIGKDERLDTDELWSDKVRDSEGPNPVVLLMGCETNLTEISFENPAVVFQDHGAAVVVTTIATILGRHASPATEALVQLLDKMADGKHTFGDIMLRLRQKLVATSTPMALGLTSYGDADWILTKEG